MKHSNIDWLKTEPKTCTWYISLLVLILSLLLVFIFSLLLVLILSLLLVLIFSLLLVGVSGWFCIYGYLHSMYYVIGYFACPMWDRYTRAPVLYMMIITLLINVHDVEISYKSIILIRRYDTIGFQHCRNIIKCVSCIWRLVHSRWSRFPCKGETTPQLITNSSQKPYVQYPRNMSFDYDYNCMHHRTGQGTILLSCCQVQVLT